MNTESKQNSVVAGHASFSAIKHAVARKFEQMKQHTLYRVSVDKDALWSLYLASFPDGTNPVYRERTEHDCSCCRHFVKTMGGVVAVIDGKVVSIWDGVADGFYQEVTETMSDFVHAAAIDNIFLHTEAQVGVEKNFQQVLDLEIRAANMDPVKGLVKETITWEHFHLHLPTTCVLANKDIGPKLAEARSTYDVFKRGLEELTLEAIDTVLDLIAQNSLYRGEEHRGAVEAFRAQKVQYGRTPFGLGRDFFTWSADTPASIKRIRNTAIGTLLIDLSAGTELEDAVNKFERSIMAPTNYKRPTALVSKAMIEKARLKIEELGYTSALERRYAVLEDITVNNILFADRSAVHAKLRPYQRAAVFGAPYGKDKQFTGEDVFAELASKVPENIKKLDKVEEVTIEKFLSDVLPKTASLELMIENRHAGNLVSLIAPVDPGAQNMFKWPNKFSWSYAGDAADSIKERVKKAGGKVDGDLRCSLSWFNYDDLDLHMKEPKAKSYENRIFYGSRKSLVTHGELDVDMNAGGGSRESGGSRSAVENITYPDRKRMTEGVYTLIVNQYRRMETADIGFEVEVEFDGTVFSFAYDKTVIGEVVVAEIEYTHKDGFKIRKSLESKQSSKQIWGMQTQTFQKVNVVMHSPNFWQHEGLVLGNQRDGYIGVGNKHYFFMLDQCRNEDRARGFFNEFLSAELEPHRKTMEMVGAKMTTEEAERQLSGLGFSSTQRNSVLCRVKGSFQRTVKVVF